MKPLPVPFDATLNAQRADATIAQSEPRPPHTDGWLWAILALVATLRLGTLSWQSLWYDEAISYRVAHGSFGGILARSLGIDAQPLSLHFVVEWLFLRFSDSDFCLRLPSALMGGGAIWLSYALANQWCGRAEARMTALLLTVSPFHLFYSQEARYPAMVGFLALWMTWTLFPARATQCGAWCHVAGAIAAALTSPLLAPSFIAHGCVVTFCRATRPAVRVWSASLLLAGMVYLVRHLLLRSHIMAVAQSVPGGSAAAMRNLAVSLPLDLCFGFWQGLALAVRQSPALDLLLQALFCCAAVYVLIGAWSLLRTPIALHICLWNVAGPIAMTLALSLVMVNNSSRYALAAQPFLFLLLAAGVVRAGRRHWLLALPGLLLIIANCLSMQQHLSRRDYQRSNWRQAFAWINSEAKADEGLVIGPEGNDILAERYLRSDLQTDMPTPEFALLQFRWSSHDWPQLERSTKAAAAQAMSSLPRLWVVLGYEPGTREAAILRAALTEFATEEVVQTFPGFPHGVTVIGYAPRRR